MQSSDEQDVTVLWVAKGDFDKSGVVLGGKVIDRAVGPTAKSTRPNHTYVVLLLKAPASIDDA